MNVEKNCESATSDAFKIKQRKVKNVSCYSFFRFKVFDTDWNVTYDYGPIVFSTLTFFIVLPLYATAKGKVKTRCDQSADFQIQYAFIVQHCPEFGGPWTSPNWVSSLEMFARTSLQPPPLAACLWAFLPSGTEKLLYGVEIRWHTWPLKTIPFVFAVC